MQMTEPAAPAEALVAELPDGQAVAEPARRALRRVQDLERAVGALRGSHAAGSHDPQHRREVVRLLCEVALFRIALADQTEHKEHNEGMT